MKWWCHLILIPIWLSFISQGAIILGSKPNLKLTKKYKKVNPPKPVHYIRVNNITRMQNCPTFKIVGGFLLSINHLHSCKKETIFYFILGHCHLYVQGCSTRDGVGVGVVVSDNSGVVVALVVAPILTPKTHLSYCCSCCVTKRSNLTQTHANQFSSITFTWVIRPECLNGTKEGFKQARRALC